jgi:site-specific recombinase XerD
VSGAVCPFLVGADAFAGLCEAFFAGRVQVRTKKSREEYRLAAWAFRRWMLAEKWTRLDEDAVKAWILHRTASAAVLTVTVQTTFVSLFADSFVDRGLLAENPFRTLKRAHRARGLRGIVRRIAETRSVAALDADADVPFSGALGSHFERYLAQRRALGIKATTDAAYLASFERFLRRRGIDALVSIDWALVEDWSRWVGETTEHNKRYRFLILAKCFEFLVAHRLVATSPIPELRRHRRRSAPPYIYSHDEVRRILAVAAALPDHRLLPYRGPTYRMYLLTLYALGLRRNEALDLRIGDIDFVEGSVTVREGKFRKGRVLPLGPKYAAALALYLEAHPRASVASADTFVFPTLSYRTPRLSHKSVSAIIATIVRDAGIVAPAGTRPPGLHSFRHSFAVHRVERWHRDGADLSVKLPLLSAFLGHTDVASTQVYLTMTPERLRLIGDVFERRFGGLATAERRDEA